MENKKLPAVFCLTEKQIQAILNDESLGVDHIAAYLTVACYTDETGIYSTAGARAIRNPLAIGQK